ncbi:hypothetical protein LCGC14_3079930 [marine sediment metagenome]|uniref:AAA domain-containing protein n=1 Tax=marine sediment metagenome TaxID=412755 RepID=A0A0F8Z4D0_9ZZZZ
MSDLASIIQKDPVRALIYSDSGKGKTSLIGLAALYEEFSPIYIFDWDLRITSLRATIPSAHWHKIESDPYRDNQVGGEAFTKMQALVGRLDPKFKSWAIDSFTSLLEGSMAHVLALDSKPPNSVPTLRNYGERQSIIKRLITTMCAKNLHLFVSCHERTAKDEVTGRLFKSFDMDPALQNRIPNYFNEIWHVEINQTTATGNQYMIRTRSDMTYSARTTFKTLADLEHQDKIWPKIIAERNLIVKK